MLYLDYAKPLADGKYILSFFADSVADLESISHGQKFVTKNGTDYGVPQAGSTVIVTSPNSGKTTYVMDAEGIWVVTEDISYSAVVANPSDAATAKLEKLKVNDTTYANWTENEIKSIASESGKKLYFHSTTIQNGDSDYNIPILKFNCITTNGLSLTKNDLSNAAKSAFNLFLTGNDETTVPPKVYIAESFIVAPNYIEVSYLDAYPGSDTFLTTRITGNYLIIDSVTEL